MESKKDKKIPFHIHEETQMKPLTVYPNTINYREAEED